MLKKKVINSLAEYQDGIVASRTMVDKSTGTVTFFAFDRGEGLSEHTAPYEAMIIITEGRAKITISGKEFKLVAGETITIPAKAPHKVFATQRFKMLLVMIKS